MTTGDNCDACNALKNRVFPIGQAKAGENLAPLHLNCDCKTAILDKNGKIAFLAEDQLDKLLSAFDFSRPWEKQADFAKQIKLWELFDFSRPWERKDLSSGVPGSMKEISQEEVLFLSKLEMIGVPFDLSLEILSEMRRTKGNIPKEKYKENLENGSIL